MNCDVLLSVKGSANERLLFANFDKSSFGSTCSHPGCSQQILISVAMASIRVLAEHFEMPVTTLNFLLAKTILTRSGRAVTLSHRALSSY